MPSGPAAFRWCNLSSCLFTWPVVTVGWGLMGMSSVEEVEEMEGGQMERCCRGEECWGEGRAIWDNMGVWGAGGVEGGLAGGELNLLKKWLNWFALSRLPDVCLSLPFIPVMFFIPVHTSLTLFCWSLASSFLL